MANVKDIFNLPLPQLKEALKGFVDLTCDYWEKQLKADQKDGCCGGGGCSKKEEDPVDEPKEEKDTAPADLKAVVHLHKAIAEKYQATGAESLLNVLAEKLAEDRDVEKDSVLDEIKEYLKVDPKKKALMAILPAERPEYVASRVLMENTGLVEKLKGDGAEDAFKELKKIAFKETYNVVPERDVLLALKVKIRDILNKNKSDDK